LDLHLVLIMGALAWKLQEIAFLVLFLATFVLA